MHLQREKWRGHDKNALCWSFFIVNDNNIVDENKLQIMRCMICHVNFVPYNLRITKRKGIITYFKKNGIIALKKHVDANHALLAKIFEEEVNFPLRNILKR